MIPRTPLVAGTAVLAANAAALVLQLAAARLLAPFVGSSLETWTAVIGANLFGIALGSAAGAGLLRRGHASGRTLAGWLFAGAVAAAWVAAGPHLLAASGLGRVLPLGARIPVLSLVFAFPAAFALAVPGPVAVELVSARGRAGRAAGATFALGTAGALAGNYLTGFALIPLFALDAIVFGTAAALVPVAGLALLAGRAVGGGAEQDANPGPRLAFGRAVGVVVLCSFAGMTLEVTAARIVAQSLGASVYTWTGVIGVILAGTAAGNWAGGRLADSAARAGTGADVLAGCLTLAAVALAGVVAATALLTSQEAAGVWLAERGLALNVVLRTAALFLAPAFLLGTVSPQVVRLAAGSGPAGAVGGRVYAASTGGAILGVFAAGYVLISTLGVITTVLAAAALPALAAPLAAPVWRRPVLLAALAVVVGGVVVGAAVYDPAAVGIVSETNYYTVRVGPADPESRRADGQLEAVAALVGGGVFDRGTPAVLHLSLDALVHSSVDPRRPEFLNYKHEEIQLDFLHAAGPRPRALVVGGGGYTFPRAARTLIPNCSVDVVEIDPGVTAVAYEHLGLDRALGVRSFHCDGRQFLEEVAAPGGYDLVTLDAVNDLSVPAHLLTRECHRAARRALAPRGVYLVTVIDIIGTGELWPAALHTLRAEFAYTDVLQAFDGLNDGLRAVYCLYASDVPLDLEALRAAQPRGRVAFARRPPPGMVDHAMAGRRLVLTDQYAPVDALMRPVYRQPR